MTYEIIFFDLDSTLYPNSNGMWDFIKTRIDLYMSEVLDIPPKIIPNLRSSYYTKYGTTLMGLVENYAIDPQDYLNFVHEIPLKDYLIHDRELDKLLRDLPSKLWVFTNSDYTHAIRVLDYIGITGHFEGIIDVWKLYPHCKPQMKAFQLAMKFSGSTNPKSCAFVDDALSNVITSSECGMFSILVGDGKLDQWPNQIQSIHELNNKFPQLILSNR